MRHGDLGGTGVPVVMRGVRKGERRQENMVWQSKPENKGYARRHGLEVNGMLKMSEEAIEIPGEHPEFLGRKIRGGFM